MYTYPKNIFLYRIKALLIYTSLKGLLNDIQIRHMFPPQGPKFSVGWWGVTQYFGIIPKIILWVGLPK